MNLMFLLRYQLKPTDHSLARRAEVARLAKVGNASLSMLSCEKRPTSSSAPQPPLTKKGSFGVTPLNDACSPVRTTEPATCQASWRSRAVLPPTPRCTSCSETAYSPNNP